MQKFYFLFLFSFQFFVFPPMATAQELSLSYERDCYEVNANNGEMYGVTATIGGGTPPYQVQINQEPFFEIMDNGSSFGFEVKDGEGFRIVAQDSDATSNEVILEETELAPCSSLCADLFFNVYLDCNENGEGILNYHILGANGDYTINGNLDGSFLPLGEAFLVEVVDEQGCNATIGGKCPLPEHTYVVEPGESIVINEFDEENEEGWKIIGVIQVPFCGELTLFDPTDGNIIYTANYLIDSCTGCLDSFVYEIQNDMGTIKTVTVQVQVISKPLRIEWELDCTTTCYNLSFKVVGGCPPYILSGYLNEVLENSGDDILMPVVVGENFIQSVSDGQGNTYQVHELLTCSEPTSYIPPCTCGNGDIQLNQLEFLCNGDGTRTLNFDGLTGGTGTYAYYFNEGWDVNAPSGTPYSITIVDEDDCYIVTQGELPSMCELVAKDTSLTTVENEMLSFLFPQQNYWSENHQIQLTTVASPSNGEIEWTESGVITYTPNSEFIGSDAFTYTIQDNSTGMQQTGNIEMEVLEFTCTTLGVEYDVYCTDPWNDKAAMEISSISNGTPPYQLSFNENPYIDFVPNQTLNILTVGSNRIIVRDANDCLSDTIKIQVDPAPAFTVSLQAPITNHIALLEVEPLHQFNAPFRVMATFTEDMYEEPGKYVFEVDTTAFPAFLMRIRDTRECEADGYIYAFRDLIYVNIDDFSSNLTNLQLYPNPNNGNFTLSLQLAQAETIEIKIVDLLGQEKLWQRLQTLSIVERHDFNLSPNLPSGLYFLQVSGKDWRTTEKVIVK